MPSQRVRDMTLVGLFTALTVALGTIYVPVPFSPVPITGQTLGMMLAGSCLGARRGAMSQVVLLVLVAIGLPVLAGGRGGLGILFGPTAGYLWMFPVAAYLIGRFTAGCGARFLPLLLPTLLFGVGLVDLAGATVLAFQSGRHLPEVLVAGVLPFLPGDTAKAIVAALAAQALRASLPGRFAAAATPDEPPGG